VIGDDPNCQEVQVEFEQVEGWEERLGQVLMTLLELGEDAS